MPSSPDTLLWLLTGFAELVKVTNHTELCDAVIAWYSLVSTRRICGGREGDEPHWTVWCWARLILSYGYSPDLLRSWRWRTTLNCAMLCSPDTLLWLHAGFSDVVKVTTNTRLWDAELAWYSPGATRRICRGWRWRTTLDCAMLCSPDTILWLLAGFAKVVKGMNRTGLCDAELAWYSPGASHRFCRGREGDEPHWTVWCWARLILS